MIKRITSIIFLLLANLIILAHAVVPHHHHQRLVCIEKEHCINDSNTDKNVTFEDNHIHDGNNNSADCVLNETIVVSTNQWKQEFKFKSNTSDPSGHNDFQNSSLNNGSETLYTVSSHFVSDHTFNFSYTNLVSASLGLRAPPVV
jgi:hypothetical protein